MTNMDNIQASRVSFYIDGFNLYYGMKEYWKVQCNPNFYWLNLKSLAESFLYPTQQLVAIKYFTSLVDYNPAKAARQAAYFRALESLGIVTFYRGEFQMKRAQCQECFKYY